MRLDLSHFLESILFVAPDNLQSATIHDFHPDFQSAAESFLDGFRASLPPDLDPDAGERSFGGNVFFTLSGHGCGFWDDRDSEWGDAMTAALRAYSGNDYRFEGLEHSLSKRRGGKLDLARKGHEVSQETRDKISQSRKGIPPWNKGKRKNQTP